MPTRKQSTRTSPERFDPGPFPLEASVIVGNNVERLRIDEGLTKTKLCAMAGITRPTLNKIESGAGDPRLSMMVKVAKALGVEVEDLLDARWWEH